MIVVFLAVHGVPGVVIIAVMCDVVIVARVVVARVQVGGPARRVVKVAAGAEVDLGDAFDGPWAVSEELAASATLGRR